MAKLTVTSVLLEYEVPLVVLAMDAKNRIFVGVNYADGEAYHLFHFSRVSESTITHLVRQKMDVRYAVTRSRIGLPLTAELWGQVGDEAVASVVKSIPVDQLPRSGMFVPTTDLSIGSNSIRRVNIDGRWGIEDLRRFSDLVQDAYAFVYALSGKGSGSTKQRMSALFRKYPWRGGFSSVNFFDDLYRIIPEAERADVSRISYASPGTIELRMDADIARLIRSFVLDINSGDSLATQSYHEAREFLRRRGWLGRAKDDIDLLQQDHNQLLEIVGVLAARFGLADQRDEIVSYANSDPLGAVKILLAYYRRLSGLADYVATGKAQDLFA